MSSRIATVAFWFGLLLAIVLYVVGLGPLEALMQARGHGIVDVELAWSPARFNQILADFGATGTLAALHQVWWDFAFIPAYSLMLWGAVVMVRRRRDSELLRAATYAVPIAAGLDVIENICLLIALGQARGSALVTMASVCASVKFVLLIAVVTVLAISWIRVGVQRLR